MYSNRQEVLTEAEELVAEATASGHSPDFVRVAVIGGFIASLQEKEAEELLSPSEVRQILDCPVDGLAELFTTIYTQHFPEDVGGDQ